MADPVVDMICCGIEGAVRASNRNQSPDQVQGEINQFIRKPQSSQTVQKSLAGKQLYRGKSKSGPWAGVGRIRESLGWGTETAGRNRGRETSEGQSRSRQKNTEREGTGRD